MNLPNTPAPAAPHRPHAQRAFTLVEIMVSMAVLSILLLISAQVIGQVQNTWSSSTARISQFREARTAFDIVTRNLSQATLNTYIDYDTSYLSDAASVMTAAPTTYQRYSDLQFICGPSATLVTGASDNGVNFLPGHAVFFQAPLGIIHDPEFAGLDRLLCGRGYFVQFTSDEFFKPPFLPPGRLKYRYRLMEFSPPAEQNEIYSAAEGESWFGQAGVNFAEGETGVARNLTRPVADNILTLIISPQLEKRPGDNDAEPLSIAPGYAYDSRLPGQGGAPPQGNKHLLPPLVRVVLVAIDERSAERLAGFDENGDPPLGSELPTFATAANLDTDLLTLEQALRDKKVNYRVFSSMIALRTSKWQWTN